jgi:hypothetical protein
MNELTVRANLRVADEVVFREVDGEAVILNLASGIYFGLDAVGTRMWQLIDEYGQLEAALVRLRAEYDAPPQTLEHDLVQLASELVEKRLLVIGNADDSYA